MMSNPFCVIKRNGIKEEVSFDKVTRRIKKLCTNLNEKINPIMIAQKVCSQIYNNVSTNELDELAAQICISMVTQNLDYGTLASRIIISNNQKSTSPSFSEVIWSLFNNKDKSGKICPLISESVYEIVMKNKDKLNDVIDYENDYLFDYFGFKTLEKSYLMRVNNVVVERIQHLFMRVSIGIHGEDLKSGILSYQMMSQKYFTHATPTLFHSGTPRPQLASCFLMGMEDSVGGIYKTVSDCAKISAGAGGIGLCLSKIRSKNSYIRGVNGTSNGIIPLCRVLNEVARHINQAGKRPGCIAVYIEPHNIEILEFLELRKNTGAESERARDLFLALTVSDLFMERVETNSEWSLFDADECPGLDDVYGSAYKTKYEQYEKDGKARKKLQARKIWNYILTSQIETGTPYILFKDAANEKSNQKNLGTIRNSNLCVTGNTHILTDHGYQEIHKLEGMEVNIWNGKEYSKSLVKKTGENQKIIKITFSNLQTIECTEYHQFYIENDGIIEVKEAIKLQENDKIENYELPLTVYNKDISVRQLNELIMSKGIFKNDEFTLNFEDKCCRILYTLQVLGIKGHVDGNIIRFSKKEIELLKDYNQCRDLVRGFEAILEKMDETESPSIYVKSIVDENKTADTYCFNEPKEHKGIFNGILAGNCIEILEYSDDKEYAVCTLASVALPNFVNELKEFNHNKLIEVMEILVNNLNKVIDVNYYPVPETRRSNERHRPIGIGVQGLIDVYYKMGFPFDSDEAKQLNKEIFETMYYGAMVASHKQAVLHGAYETFPGSPLSEGKFQFNLWGLEDSDRYDWGDLRKKIMETGVRNSLCIALMPTASTSQILGNNECFEPITSNIYSRRTVAGDFVVVNKYLIQDLMKLDVWNEEIKNKIIEHGGSIQKIEEIPDNIKELYKTVWETKQKHIIDQAGDRGPFVCQTQSMNLFFEEPTQNTLTSAFFYGWKKGLKTGCYYIRTRPKAQAQQFTIDAKKVNQQVQETNYKECEMCSA